MMNKAPFIISGPYTHEKLTIFLFHGADQIDGSRYTSLKEAFDKKQVRVHETGNVGQLEAENLSETIDLFIQAGDVLKGGRQDRTIAIDFIIPAKSGRVPVPTFCVERGRWRKRHGEHVEWLNCPGDSVHAKSIRLAAQAEQSQAAVWSAVAETQEILAAAVGACLHATPSPTSYQLSIEHPDLKRRKREYQDKLHRIAAAAADAVGYAFYINGERNTIDTYASANLFHSMWHKLLDVAILEAISAQNGTWAFPDKTDVETWLETAGKAQLGETKDAPPRTRIERKSYQNGVIFETFDQTLSDHAALHTNIISQ
jgi:hypothetical protein